MEYRLKPIGKQLVRVCHRSLSHNHSRVRVAVLKAICRYFSNRCCLCNHLFVVIPLLIRSILSFTDAGAVVAAAG